MAHTTTAEQGLDPHALRLIRHKARQLIRRPEFSAADREDIEQELALDLLVRLWRFDASRATRPTFVDRVVNHRVATLLEARGAAKRSPITCVASLDDEAAADEGRPVPLWATIDQRLRRRNGRPDDDPSLRDLRVDVANAVRELPPELHQLADELAVGSQAAAARSTGASRHAVRTGVARIRARFERAGLRIYVERVACEDRTGPPNAAAPARNGR